MNDCLLFTADGHKPHSFETNFIKSMSNTIKTLQLPWENQTQKYWIRTTYRLLSMAIPKLKIIKIITLLFFKYAYSFIYLDYWIQDESIEHLSWRFVVFVFKWNLINRWEHLSWRFVVFKWILIDGLICFKHYAHHFENMMLTIVKGE